MEALRVLSLSSQPLKHIFYFAAASSFSTNSVTITSSSRLFFRCCSSSSTANASARVAGRNRRPSSETPSSTSDRDAVRAIRLKKVEELRGQGLEPYAYKWERTHTANQLQDIYRNLGNGEESTRESDCVSVAGRIVARRAFGKLAFLTLRDDSGTIQLYCEKERLANDQFEMLKTLVDIGDILGANGSIKRTEKGELSVKLNSFAILTKSLLPLPDKYHGLTDVDKRYRQRICSLMEIRKRDRMRESAIKRVSCKTKSLGGEGSPTKLQPPYLKTRRPPCFHDHKNNTHGTPNTTACRSVFSGMPHQNPAKSKRMDEYNKIRRDFQWLWQDTFCISTTTKIRPITHSTTTT